MAKAKFETTDDKIKNFGLITQNELYALANNLGAVIDPPIIVKMLGITNAKMKYNVMGDEGEASIEATGRTNTPFIPLDSVATAFQQAGINKGKVLQAIEDLRKPPETTSAPVRTATTDRRVAPAVPAATAQA